METINNDFTAERSLELISRTIEQSRRAITRGSWKIMLVWGISVTVIALVVGHLWQHSSLGSSANGLWGLLGFVAIGLRLSLRGKPRFPSTFVSKTISQVWGCMGILGGSMGFVLGTIGGMGYSLPLPFPSTVAAGETLYYPITALIILMVGIAGMISGRILKSNAIAVCCFLVAFFGPFFALVYRGPQEMLVLAASATLGLIVPALIIKTKEA